MEAGKVRQSKTRHEQRPGTGEESSAPPNSSATVESANGKQPPSSLNSVSWLAARIAAALIGGLILRLWMMQAFPQIGGDALIYGNIAKGLVQHGVYAITDGSGVLHTTLIRLPGYPLFLAACFKIFGTENYTAVAWLQIFLELAACLLLADFVRGIASTRSGLNTLWLATMCPFTAVYASAPLTESLTFDAICLALWSLHRYLYSQQSELKTSEEAGASISEITGSSISEEMGCPILVAASSRQGWAAKILTSSWFFLGLFTAAISAAALLRPDGALVAFAVWPALIFSRKTKLKPVLTKALLCAVVSVLPFVAWTIRNASTFHVFEPLAPRYANDPGEDPHLGWQHWVKTWCLDFTCTSDIYWNVPDGTISADDLPTTAPNPAWDSPQQKGQTEALIAEYNQTQQISPSLDARFEALADERAQNHPIRTYILLPLGRLADMTFRPRVENLTIDLRWWEYWNHRPETRFSYTYAALNGIFLALGLAGFLYRPKLWPYMGAYLLLRSALLCTIEAPETRYTLEFFPILFALGGITLHQIFRSKNKSQT